MTPTISIIIPTYNRANLINETLDSIVAQTYTNWECIVVDDDSSDDTDIVLKTYCKKDKRIKYYPRPNHLPKGANSCRNYGFSKCKGKYIQWFDSDDLMLPKHLEIKIQTIQKYNVHFVICETKYFNIENHTSKYNFKEENINFLSYATSHISWYTPAALLKRSIAEKINFNVELKAGQEYNYFCKVLLITNNLKIIPSVLVLLRSTPNSIGNNRRKDRIQYLISKFNIYWTNYLELHKQAKSNTFNKHALIECLSSFFYSKGVIKLTPKFRKHLFKVFKWKIIYFYFAYISLQIFGKYHFFYNKLKQS